MYYKWPSASKIISNISIFENFNVKTRILLVYLILFFELIQVSASYASNGIEENQEVVSSHLGSSIHIIVQPQIHLIYSSSQSSSPHLRPNLHVHPYFDKELDRNGSQEKNNLLPLNVSLQHLHRVEDKPRCPINSKVTCVLKYQLKDLNSGESVSEQTAIFSIDLGSPPKSRLEGFNWMNKITKGLENSQILNKWRADLMMTHRLNPNESCPNVNRLNTTLLQKNDYSPNYPLSKETYRGIEEAAIDWLQKQTIAIKIIFNI